MFKLLVWDCYAWSAWQFFQVKDRKGNYRDIPGNWNQYAGYFPLWWLSYSIIPYIRMKFEQSGLGFQNLYNIPQGRRSAIADLSAVQQSGRQCHRHGDCRAELAADD